MSRFPLRDSRAFPRTLHPVCLTVFSCGLASLLPAQTDLTNVRFHGTQNLLVDTAEFTVQSGATFTADTGSVVDLFNATVALPSGLSLVDIKLSGSGIELQSGGTLTLNSGSTFVASAGSAVNLSAATVTFPSTVVLTTATQILTNKTLVAPTISSISSAAATNLTLSAPSGASVTVGEGTNANVTVTPSGTGALVFSPSGQPNLGFQIGGGQWWTSGVPYIRPTQSGSPGILDVLANGSGVDSWIDIGSDYVSDRPNGEFLELRKTANGYGSILVKGLGTGQSRPLVLQPNSGLVGFNQATSPTEQYHAKLDQDFRTSFVVENAHSGTSAFSSVEARNSTSYFSYLRLITLGQNWGTNGAFTQNGAALEMADGLTGDLSILTRGTGSPISFYTGGYLPANRVMTLSTTQNVLIGGTTNITGSGGLKVFGATDNTANTAATGAFQVLGGASISKSLNVLGGRASTSTTTGDLIVSGGAGIGGSLYLGGSLACPAVGLQRAGFSWTARKRGTLRAAINSPTIKAAQATPSSRSAAAARI